MVQAAMYVTGTNRTVCDVTLRRRTSAMAAASSFIIVWMARSWYLTTPNRSTIENQQN